MVASQHEKVLRVLNFIGEHETDGLDGLFAPVDVVPQEQIVGLPREASVLEELNKVGILTVNVT